MLFIRFGKFSAIISEYISVPFSSLSGTFMMCVLDIMLSYFSEALLLFSFCSLHRIVSVHPLSSLLILSLTNSHLLLSHSSEFFIVVTVVSKPRISMWLYFVFLLIILSLMGHCHHTFLYLCKGSIASFSSLIIFIMAALKSLFLKSNFWAPVSFCCLIFGEWGG